MQYLKVIFRNAGPELSDMLIATLADAGYDGFEETGRELLAYIEVPKFRQDELSVISAKYGVAPETEEVPQQNWNTLWESNFQPVVVDGFCSIRAHFHTPAASTPYEIIITPKMSFGTGHHATTQLMIQMMREINFTGRSVLDFGTGTGVLAILAEMLGASSIIAIDNDEWSTENARENVARNNCSKIQILQGSIEDSGDGGVDVILANINRNILLQYMPALYGRLNGSGRVLMSGLLKEDEEIIVKSAIQNNLRATQLIERKGWIALLFDNI